VYELDARRDTPARVVITEYVDIAHAFYDGQEPGMVNGMLDRISRTLRPEEFGDVKPEDGKSGDGNSGDGSSDG
jgi:N utilization substance protein B